MVGRFFRGMAAWLLFALISCHVAEAATHVGTVHATINSAVSVPPLVKRRMETTVEAIGAQLIAGRSVDDVTASRENDEKIISEVFDKVLVGYSVESTTVTPGVVTMIDVRLIPWADVIKTVEVDVRVEGMPPLVEELARRDLADVGSVFSGTMEALPVAASDWTNGVLKKSLGDYMESHLPEFRADFDVEPGETSRVSLIVYPRLPVVRTVDLSMRSSSVPNITLLNHREEMQSYVNSLIGVPVSFVARHSGELATRFAEKIDAAGDFRELGLKTSIVITPAENAAVMSRSDTEKYLIRLEGWADVARRDPNDRDLVFRLHVGRRFTKSDELFVQTDFLPQAVRWDWELGYARHFAPWTKAIVRYDMEGKRFAVGAEQIVSPKWLLRYEYRWTDHRGEAAARYLLHDFMSLEYAVDNEDSWLRVIGNF